MHDGIIQLMGEELAANGLRQISSIKTFDGSMVSGRFLVPGQLCDLALVPKLYERDFTHVYYISDLHLETWFDEYCKKAKAPEQSLPIFEWIETVMDSLFSGDFYRILVTGIVSPFCFWVILPIRSRDPHCFIKSLCTDGMKLTKRTGRCLSARRLSVKQRCK